MLATNINSKHTGSRVLKKRPGTGERNARWRESKAAKVQSILTELNVKRAQFNLPKVSLTLPKKSQKGIKRPNYSPPTEMSAAESKKWKQSALMKRKAAKQRENRRIKSELLKNFNEQLAILNKMIEYQKMFDEAAMKPIATLEQGIAMHGLSMLKPDLLKGFKDHLVVLDKAAADLKKGAEPATNLVFALDDGIAVSIQGKLKPVEVPGNATASLQRAPVIAEEAVEDLMNSSFDGLDGIDCESLADGDLDSTNVTTFVPANLVFDTKESVHDDTDDSSWADGSSFSLGEDFDVPITNIFDDEDSMLAVVK